MTDGKAVWAGFRGGMGEGYGGFLMLITSVKRDLALEGDFHKIQQM